MEHIIVVIRMVLLMLSVYGYVRCLAHKIQPELAIGVIFAGIGSLMFLAGLLSFMAEMTWLIFGAGLCLMALSIRRKESIRPILTPGLLFFVVAAGFFAYLLYGSKFTHYDNFSHWGLAVKALCMKGYFPDFTNTHIAFQSYPLGSACFIYYVCKVVGISQEWLQTWAQAFLMTGMTIGLFAFAKKRTHILMAAVGAIVLLCSNTNFIDLLVDTLLPLTAVSAMCFCIYYKRDIFSYIRYVIPYTVFLVSIKNSGMLFAAFVLFYVLLCIGKNPEQQKKWIVYALIPVITVFLWQKHVDYAFYEGAVSKHAMTMENFLYVLGRKSLGAHFYTLVAFIKKIFSLTNPALYMLLAGGLIFFYLQREKPETFEEAKKLLAFTGLTYIVYMAGVLGMYFVTMPPGEAISMAGYDRYHKTVLIFVAGLFLIGMMRAFADWKWNAKTGIRSAAIPAVIFLLMCISLSPNFAYYKKQSLNGTERAHFDAIIERHNIQPGKRYLILTSEDRNDSGYLYFMTEYLFMPSVSAIDPVSVIDENWRDMYDYIIVFEATEENKQHMLEHFGDENLEAVCLNPALMQ